MSHDTTCAACCGVYDLARCDHWSTVTGLRCESTDPRYFLIAPDGDRVPGGPLCTSCAVAVVTEYRNKLGGDWRLVTIHTCKLGGEHVSTAGRPPAPSTIKGGRAGVPIAP